MTKSKLSINANSFVPKDPKNKEAEAEAFIKALHKKEQKELEEEIKEKGIDKIWQGITLKKPSATTLLDKENYMQK
jgi:hypothetical protein